MEFHIAQINVARPKAAMESCNMAGFTNAIDAVNAFAEASPGFVWRLKEEVHPSIVADVTGFDPYGDGLLINISVWKDLESLKTFVYKTGHASFIRRRSEWFEKMDQAHTALWWVPVGAFPTAEEAVIRLALVNKKGSTRQAFTFAHVFTPR